MVSYPWAQLWDLSKLSEPSAYTLRNVLIIYAFHQKSSIINARRLNQMNFILVEGILLTNMFESIRNKDFSKTTYVL